MKKFLVLILALLCSFAIVFTACFDSNGKTDNSNDLGGNRQEQNGEQDNNKDSELTGNVEGNGGSQSQNPENPGQSGGENNQDEDEGNGNGGESGNSSQQPQNPENPGQSGGENNQDEDEGNGNEGEGGDNTEQPENPENPEEPEEPEPQEPVEPEPHVCTYSSYWSCNDSYHWRASTCPEHPDKIDSRSAHNYVSGRCKDCKVSSSSIYKVGDRIPDYTFETFKSAYKDSTYSLASARGKVLIINFWYVNCGPCVSEMPDIEGVRQQFGDDVVVLALHSSGSEHASDLAIAQTFIDINNPGNNNKTPWTNYQTIFGKDIANEFLYNKIGGDGYYPKTVVVDAEGIITSIIHGNIIDFNMETFQRTNKLIPAVQAALKNKKTS